MHRFVWKHLSVTLTERSRASSPTSLICSSPRLLSSNSTTSDSETDSDNKQKSSIRPSSAQRVFEECGFSQTQIKSIVSRYPKLLRCVNPEKIYKPKISFFRSIGIQADVAKMLTRYPPVLRRSLNNHLIPTFDFLKSLLGSEDNAICLIKRCPYILHHSIGDTLPVNLSTLRRYGVPESNILKMLSDILCEEIIVRCEPQWFTKVVESVMKMGFATSSTSFGSAVTAMGYDELTWEKKIKFYQALGFSREEIFSLFKRQPISMYLSQKKVREAVEFYHDKLCWGPSELAMRPILLMHSLHKKVIPRCSVLQVLWSRNCNQKSPRLVTVLQMTEKAFLETYVKKYQGEFPEVLDAYQGKLNFDTYNFDAGRKRKELAKVVLS